jgi:threonine/homoserine/homoserine lactone efflux protein
VLFWEILNARGRLLQTLARGSYFAVFRMSQSIHYLFSGALFGLVAGISPGPLLALVITETIRYDARTGVLVAIAPVITDVPIVFLSIFILSRISGFNIVLGIISLAGSLFISYLAYESITVKSIESSLQKSGAGSLRKGIITNFLSPNPYLFWITVGAPSAMRASRFGLTSPVFFIAGFYLFLVGSKIAVALLVDKSKAVISSRIYVYIVRVLGAALVVFAVLFLKEALELLGVI